MSRHSKTLQDRPRRSTFAKGYPDIGHGKLRMGPFYILTQHLNSTLAFTTTQSLYPVSATLHHPTTKRHRRSAPHPMTLERKPMPALSLVNCSDAQLWLCRPMRDYGYVVENDKDKKHIRAVCITAHSLKCIFSIMFISCSRPALHDDLSIPYMPTSRARRLKKHPQMQCNATHVTTSKTYRTLTTHTATHLLLRPMACLKISGR